MAGSHAVALRLIHTRSGAIALVAVAQALPWLVHLLHLPGPVLLPIHFAALLGGLALGPIPGLVNGLAAPAVSFLLTGLPPVALVPLLGVEAAVYGAVAGLLAYHTACRGGWVVLAALAAGRVGLLAAAAIMGPALGLHASAVSFVLHAAWAGWAGIALQVGLLAPAARALALVGPR